MVGETPPLSLEFMLKFILLFNLFFTLAATKPEPPDEEINLEDEERKPKLEEDFPPFLLTQWEEDIIYDSQLSSSKMTNSARQNAAYAGWIPSQHCRTMAAFQVSETSCIIAQYNCILTDRFSYSQDTYQGKYPGILGYKTLMGTGLNNQTPFAANTGAAGSAGSGVGGAPNGPYAFFPVENPRILDDSWRFDIIYDPPAQAAANTPFLLTLDKNDERCVLDSIVNDDEIMAAAAPALGRQQRDAQDGSGPGHANRASFHVTFGYASTRGTLTGALAKAEKGAEKVKRILGKVRAQLL